MCCVTEDTHTHTNRQIHLTKKGIVLHHVRPGHVCTAVFMFVWIKRERDNIGNENKQNVIKLLLYC